MKKRKRCPGDNEIQAFIDKELSPSDSDNMSRHAEKCSECAGKIEGMSKWSSRIKLSVRSSDPTEISVPQWVGKGAAVGGKRTSRLIWQMGGAAALIAVILTTTTIIIDCENESYKPTPYEFMIWEENSAGNDANRLWHNRAVTIMITTPDGETEIFNLN